MTWFTVELQVESTHYCRIEAPDRNAAQRWARRARTDVLRSLGELGPEEEYAGVDSVEYSIHKAAGPWAPPAYTDRAAETAPPYQALQATPPTVPTRPTKENSPRRQAKELLCVQSLTTEEPVGWNLRAQRHGIQVPWWGVQTSLPGLSCCVSSCR